MNTFVIRIVGAIVIGLGMLAISSTPARATTLTVTSSADSGTGSLRAVLGNASDGDVIVFASSLAGGNTINLLSALLVDKNNITIDGTVNGHNHDIVLNNDTANKGCAIYSGIDGLVITASNTTIKGLTVQNFFRGLSVVGAGASGNTIQNNYTGTDSTGSSAMGNCFGIILWNSANQNLIANNLISGNNATGLAIYGANENIVQGNLIGPNITVQYAIPNGSNPPKPGKYPNGIEVFGLGTGIGIDGGSKNNLIGGTTPSERNIISGNGIASGGDGIYIDNPGSTGNMIKGNYIGTKADGSSPMGNEGNGITVFGGADGLIQENIIAFNGLPTRSGVFVTHSAIGYHITRNSIFQNNGLGIDLDTTSNYPDGPTDGVCTGTNGGNNLFQRPEITSIIGVSGNFTVTGQGCPNATIELYIADPDPSEYGEGKTYLTFAIADGNGIWSIDNVNVGDETQLTCNQTDGNGNTSEFSLNKSYVATIQETRAYIQYDNWRGVIDATANSGTYRVSNVKNDTATFKFKGKSIKWISRKGSDQGKAQVKIDGVDKGTFDLYSATPAQFVKTFKNLQSGKHKIVIQVTGAKNSNSTNTNVTVDGFVAGGSTTQENAPTVGYNKWSGKSDANASSGTYRFAKKAGANAKFTFTGTSVNWITAKGPSYGVAQVLIDGVSQGNVDLYDPIQQWKFAKSFTGLTDTQHTIEIKVLGTKNAASSGTTIIVDAFQGPFTAIGQ